MKTLKLFSVTIVYWQLCMNINIGKVDSVVTTSRPSSKPSFYSTHISTRSPSITLPPINVISSASPIPINNSTAAPTLFQLFLTNPLYIGIGVSGLVTVLFCLCTFCYVCIRNICCQKHFHEDPVDSNIPYGEALRPSEGMPVQALAEIVSVHGERESMRRFVNSIITIDPTHIIGAFFPQYATFEGRASESNNDGAIEMVINPRYSASQSSVRRSSLTNYSIAARPGGTSFNQSFAINNNSVNRLQPQIMTGGSNRLNTGGSYQLPTRGPLDTVRDSGSSSGSSEGNAVENDTSPVDILARFEATSNSTTIVDTEQVNASNVESTEIASNDQIEVKDDVPAESIDEQVPSMTVDPWAEEVPPGKQSADETRKEESRESFEPAFETALTSSDIFDAATVPEHSFTPTPEYKPTPILLAPRPIPEPYPVSVPQISPVIEALTLAPTQIPISANESSTTTTVKPSPVLVSTASTSSGPTSASQRNMTARLSSMSHGSNSLSGSSSPITPLPPLNTTSSTTPAVSSPVAPKPTATIPAKAPSSSSLATATSSSSAESECKPLRSLTMDEVLNLLTSLQMSKFKQIFLDNEISGRILCEMETGEDLIDMEVKLPKPHERMFLKVLSDYRLKGVPLSVLK